MPLRRRRWSPMSRPRRRRTRKPISRPWIGRRVSQDQTGGRRLVFGQESGRYRRGRHRLMRVGLGPNDPAVAKSLKYLETFVQTGRRHLLPQEPACRTTKPRWPCVCFQEANRDHRYDKTRQKRRAFLKSIQWGGEDQPAEKSNLRLWRSRLRQEQTARPVEHPVLYRCPEGGRRRTGRPGDAKRRWSSSPAARTWRARTTPPPSSAKHPDGSFYYTPAAGGNSAGRQGRRRRPAQLRLDDLRRPEEHDLCRRQAGRPPRQGRREMVPDALRPRGATPAWAMRASSTTITPSPRPWTPPA